MTLPMSIRRSRACGVLVLALLSVSCGNGDRLALNQAGPIPIVTQQAVGVPTTADERVKLVCPVPGSEYGDDLSARLELPDDEQDPTIIHLRWFGLAGAPVQMLELPSTLVVYGMLVAKTSGGDDVLLTVGYDAAASRGELAWWPHTSDPTLPISTRTVLVQGAVDSIFFDTYVHAGDLLILDIQCNEIYRVVDSNADGIWDVPAAQPFASSALLEQGSSATRVRLATTGQTKAQAHATRSVPVWEIVDANSDGVAEQLVQVAVEEGHFAPRVLHSLTDGVVAMLMSMESGTSYRVLAVGKSSNEELAAGTAGQGDGDAEPAIILLSRALVEGETIIAENVTHSVSSDESVVGSAADSLSAVIDVHTFDAQDVWTG